MGAPLARSLWLAGVDVIANPLQPKAQFLLFSKPPHSKTLATDLVEKNLKSQFGYGLGSCGHVLAHWPSAPITVKTMSPCEAHGVHCVQFPFYLRKTIIEGISQLCNSILASVEAEGRKSWGKNAPSSENYPVHNTVILLPLHRQPPLWRTAGFRTWVVLTALGVACRLCFVILTSSHKGGFHPSLCETTHLWPLIIN